MASAASTARVSSRLCADHWPEIPAGGESRGLRHQRRARAHLPVLGVGAVSSTSACRSGATGSATPDYWKAIDELPDAPFWATAQDVKSRMLAGVRARLEREYRRKGLGPVQLRAHHASARSGQSQCADDRLRAPLCHLQARRADPARSRAPAAPGVRTRTGPCCSCSPARRIRPTSRGSRCCARSSSAMLHAGVRRPRRVPRGLRHPAGALAGHGRRRLAQQSDRAAGSQRHLRHQGCGQRPTESFHPRRLVGRGLRRPQRLGHSGRRRAG